ncbi:MAG TPA: hypothetical protein VNA65_07265 [Candidatus Dormibacteraeota bacterium]|nr:hypothetical protein [Candidatus Dormibacteraeota bacterium]
MIKRPLISIVVLIATVACGGSASAPPGPTVASVSVQQSDLPSGMVQCGLTGDIQHFISAEQTPDPTTSKSMTSYWQDAQKSGATHAFTAIYADSATNCSALKSPNSDISTATYKLVVNFTVQYKDAKSAASAYTSGNVFGFSPAQLKTGGASVLEGTQTGLTANSIVLNTTIPPQSFYIAEWQNKTFLVILAILNVDAGTSKSVALAQNGRIK